ncbi:MAG: peptidase protein, partial [Chthonomonadales bacterium]|nr:peptidase protein [Chthonomonadales bacterium]
LGVNGSLFTLPRLQEAVRATRTNKAPMELLVSNENRYQTIKIAGLNGEQFPVLVRDPARPDLFSAIIAPAAGP